MANIKEYLKNNEDPLIIYTAHSMSMMVCKILLCVYACLKQQNYAKCLR